MNELAKMMHKFLKLCLFFILSSFTLKPMVNAQQSYAGPPGKSCTCGYVGQLFVRSFDNQYYKFVPCRGGLPVFLYNGYLDAQRTYKFSLYVNVSTHPTAARNSKIVTWVDYSVTAVINYKGKQTMMKLLHHNYNAYPLRHGANAEIPELLPYRERSGVYFAYPVGLGTKTGQGSKTFFTIPGNQNPIAELEIEPLYGNVYLIVNDVQASGTNAALCGRCDQRVNRATSVLELSRMNTGAAYSLNIPICNDYSIDYININAPVPCLSGAGNAYCKYLCDPNVLKYCPECKVLSHKCYSDLYKKNLHWCPLIQSVVAKIFHENRKYLPNWQKVPYCYLDRTMADPLLCKANFQSNATTEMMGKSDYKGCRAPARNLQLKAILGSACYCQNNLLEHSQDKAQCVHSKSCQCATTVYRTNWYLILTRQAFMTQGCKQRCMCIPKVHNQLTYYEFDCTQYTMPKDSMCTPENEAYKMIKNLKAVHCSAKAFSIWKYQVYARVPEQVWCKPGFSGCAMTDEPCQDIPECDYMKSGRKYGNVTFEPCKPGYTCENTAGSFVCRPPPGVTETPPPFICPSVKWPEIVGPSNAETVPVLLEPFCDKRPCSPHADCTYDWRRICNVTCTCRPGFSSGNTGYECERPCSKNDEYYCAKNNVELKTKKCVLDERGQKKCVCKTGFRMNSLRKSCIDIDECGECKHQCVQHSMCKNEIGGYQCVCLPGYFGNAIDECKEVDECSSGIAECDSNADCINKRPGYECRCRLGWQGAPSPGTISQPCVDTNECVVMPQACGTYTKCINKPGSYVCVCLPGNFRKIDAKNCEDIDECTEASYQDQPCNSNANCINTPGSYSCECKSGFVGDGFSCKADDSYCKICQPGTTRCVLTSAQNRYMCQCLPGYVKVMGSDTACQVEPKCGDPNKNQCDKVNAVCINDASRLEGYACRCKVGFMGDGRSCYRPDPCESNPCLVVPFSQCRKTPMGTFTCICVKGYTQQGQRCVETAVVVKAHNCSRCDPLKQTCVPDDRDPKLFTCKCNLGYMMMPDGQCHNIDECLRMDLNNCDPEFASCIDRVPHLHNGKQFDCFCKRGFTGNGLVNGCKDIEECTQLNMRVCPNPNTYCVNTIGSYRCVCGKGFEELMPNMPEPVACVDIPECERGIAQCASHSDCINTVGSYRCQCSKGFAPQGQQCVDRDECLDQPCNMTVASCKNTIGSFVCVCKSGFRGEECLDINECTEGLHSCNDNQICNNTFGGYICICKPGFKPTPDGKSCVDINECLEMAGGGMAYPLGGGVMNNNPFDDFGAGGNGYGPPRIPKTNVVSWAPNLGSGQGPCDPKSQVCENIIGGYFCRCRKHYDTIDNSNPKMPLCRLIDLCNRNGINPCGGGTCRINENPPYFTCICPRSSVQVNTSFCATPTYCDAQFPCPPESYCKNGNCECNPGYQWLSLPPSPLYDASVLRNRQSCKPINPCTLPQPPCKRDQFCKYIGPGVYECICPVGYIYSRTTGNCENINECLNATIICPKNSDCYDTPGSYRCVCNRGFRNVAPPTAPRPFCQDINECLNIFSYTCGMYQHCVNDEGSYHCECNYGYYATQINPLVCQDIDECNNATVRMCSSDAKCTNTPGSFYCTCNVGFYGDGKFCRNINECDPMRFTANCSGIREQCEDTIGSYKCLCRQGFERRNGFCENIDECNMNLHNCNTLGVKMKMVCIDKVPGFLCQCPMGFRWNPSTRDCEDIDECMLPYMNNCTMFHAKCRNTYGSFACDCLRGFMRDPTCPAVLCPCVNINECQNYTACAPNAICQDMTPGYLCTCNMGYVGDGYRECRAFNQCVATTAKCGQEQKCIVSNQKPFCTCVDPRKFLPNEDNSRCLGNPCTIYNGGCIRPSACISSIRNGRFEASCRCPPGYLPGADNPRRCDPINGCGCPGNNRSCESIRCPAQSRCYNVAAGQFVCLCKPGFKKVGASCLDTDECKEGLSGRPRVCEFDCKNTIGSFECTCPVGKMSGMLGKCVADAQCFKQDQCNYVPNSYCNYVKGNDSFLCECKNGFTGIPTAACNPVQFCTRNPCPSDEICIDTYRSFRCDCKPGFQRGAKGCVDIDECLQSPCPKGQLCNNTVGSYVCGCYQGYRMSNLGSCIDINECTEKLHNCNPTTEICVNYAPGFSCQCRFPQFVAVNNTCINNDECKTGFNTCPVYSICLDTYGGYNCSCMRGTIARIDTQNNRLVSCDDIDECKGLSDRNQIPACDVNAICKNHYAGYSCECRPGYFGSGAPGNCFEKQLCPGQCGPNAYCLRNQFSVYNCTCAPDFRGDGRICEEIDKCKEMKCNKLAQCKRVNRGTFICQCRMPYEGDGLNYCTRIHFCDRGYHDCPFGSSCLELEKMGNDGRWYQCKCPPGLYFNETTRFCQDIRECEQRPSVCPKEATCVEKVGTYMCICATGYIYNFRKNTCDDINECLMPSLCQPFGRCENIPGSYKCICNAGFRWNERLRVCMDINECTENLHQCDTKSSVCYNLIGSYTCACKFGFQSVPGTSPQKCEDKDECKTNEHSCSSYAKCINTYGSYTCKCFDTYSGDGFVCFEIPTCTNLKCGQNAVCLELSPKEKFKNPVCTCKNGYESKNPAQGCTMVDLCLKLNNPCGHGIGQCSPLASSYNCTCNKGYYFNGFTCVDYDECKNPKPVCGENAICKNTIGSYNCTCIQGFDGDPYVMCKPIDLCTTTDVRFRKQCPEQGYCFDNACVCKAGFAGDGITCNNINECLLPGICNTFAYCKDTIGSYMCVCKLGFSGDGSVCNDIDECSNITMPCDTHADCTNTQGSYVCTCKKGWDSMIFDRPPTGAPQTCQNVNECLSPYLNLCDPKTSRCFDTPGDYECQCLTGYKRPNEADKRTCIDIDECAQGKCDVVTSTCVNTPGSYTCVCKTGFTRSPVDPNSCIDINECIQNPCDPHATCENLIGSFKCTCTKTYKGDGFQCKIINPCIDPALDPCDKATSVCNFTEAQGAFCTCLPGFEQVPTADGHWTCQDMDECDPIRPRHTCNLTKEHCVNLPGGFRCDCNEGYKSMSCADGGGYHYFHTCANSSVNKPQGKITCVTSEVGKDCIEINECEEPANQGNNFCTMRRAICKDDLRGFHCVCPENSEHIGTENDFVCMVKDPCRGKNNCTGNTKCKRASIKLGYICECADGFKQATNLKTGEKYCRASLQPCKKNADCPEHCQCDVMKGFCQTDRGFRFALSPDGSYKKSPDGKFLVIDIDECKESQNTCSEGCGVEGLKCQNTIGSFKCLCPNGQESIACKCESSCKANVCKWNRQCYEKGLDSIDCNCREMPEGERQNREICVKEGNVANYYPHPIFFYNALCQTSEDDCGFPENEADIQKARDFNYFGQCQFDIAAVKCEFGVKPMKRGAFIFCDYPLETRSYLANNCTSTTNAR